MVDPYKAAEDAKQARMSELCERFKLHVACAIEDSFHDQFDGDDFRFLAACMGTFIDLNRE